MSVFQGITALVATLFSLIAIIPYVISIYKKKTQPRLSSWIIWSCLNLAIAASSYALGATITLGLSLAYFFGDLIIVIVAIFCGVGNWRNWERLDWWCIGIFGASLVVWYMFNSPLTALLMNLGLDWVGGTPTIKNLWANPGSEDKWTWFIFWIGALANILTINKFEFGIMVYPISLFILVSTIFFLALKKIPRNLTAH